MVAAGGSRQRVNILVAWGETNRVAFTDRECEVGYAAEVAIYAAVTWAHAVPANVQGVVQDRGRGSRKPVACTLGLQSVTKGCIITRPKP